jgi:hypothetical protein
MKLINDNDKLKECVLARIDPTRNHVSPANPFAKKAIDRILILIQLVFLKNLYRINSTQVFEIPISLSTAHYEGTLLFKYILIKWLTFFMFPRVFK